MARSLTRRVRGALPLLRLLLVAEWGLWVEAALLGTIVPLLVWLVFSQWVADAEATRLRVGCLLLGGMLTVTRFAGESMVMLHSRGLTQLLRAHGATRAQYVAVRCAQGALLSAVPLAGAAWTAPSGGALPASGPVWLGVLAVASASLLGLGMCIAAFARTLPTANMVLNTVLAVSVSFSPLLYASERVPDLLRPLVTSLPPALAADLLTSGWNGAPLPAAQLAALLGWSAALLAIGVRRAPWDTDFGQAP